MDFFEKLKKQKEEKKKQEQLAKANQAQNVLSVDRRLFSAADPDDPDSGSLPKITKNAKIAFDPDELQTVFVSDNEEEEEGVEALSYDFPDAAKSKSRIHFNFVCLYFCLFTFLQIRNGWTWTICPKSKSLRRVLICRKNRGRRRSGRSFSENSWSLEKSPTLFA